MENKSQVAGILSIVSGAFGVLGMGCMVMVVRIMRIFLETESTMPHEMMRFMVVFYLGIGVILTILGILGIVSGVFAIQKKYWGLALAGAIAGIFTFFPCGIAAVVIIALAKPEFNLPASVLPPSQPPAS